MAKRPFSTSPHYEQSLRGLHRLHELSVAGQDDSPEAEAVRAGLERPWDLLSETEKKRITGLSEDLYSLNTPQDEPLPPNPQVQRKLNEAYEAQQVGEWDRALEILRRWQRYVDPALLSYIRGMVWFGAGDYRTSALFSRHASLLIPSESNFASLYLMALGKSDPVAALARAEEILAADGVHSPRVVDNAARLVFMPARGMEAASSHPISRRLIPILERTLGRAKEDQDPLSMASLTCTSIEATLGLCYDTVGDYKSALSHFNSGLALEPDNEALLVARGILRYSVEPGAVEDFKEAIRGGSRTVWPYYFLAHHELVSNRFGECLRLCERALECEAPDEVKGDLFEWSAIARSEMRFPAESVRSMFEEAVRLAPNSDRIRRNFRAFEQAETKHEGRLHQWDKPREAVVREFGRSSFSPLAA
jgi:tetratricopeptide (TPR) repeat protein